MAVVACVNPNRWTIVFFLCSRKPYDTFHNVGKRMGLLPCKSFSMGALIFTSIASLFPSTDSNRMERGSFGGHEPEHCDVVSVIHAKNVMQGSQERRRSERWKGLNIGIKSQSKRAWWIETPKKSKYRFRLDPQQGFLKNSVKFFSIRPEIRRISGLCRIKAHRSSLLWTIKFGSLLKICTCHTTV